ncbi:rop guanine nucleotide exchange factor 3-like [Impatiens glandulifera]|uniref:rop guanine nucleotide exchange factor 3-like n=1 Tax=Impatiens glandulifera TaxID=253017 RepID=UPI001FB0CD23|nr:rop guanine nucleotide exchange factor 3-like [Impatiens glandulifera]
MSIIFSDETSPHWPLSKSPNNNNNDPPPTPLESAPAHTEIDLMKERFSKLLLGEDMSGSGKGVCTAVTISNAITNLYASIFGQHQRLEPLHPEKAAMWKREMNCLLSVCNYITESIPLHHNLLDGAVIQVMANTARRDIHVNLPALRKLDNMLLVDVLESFKETEFWYVKQGGGGRSSNSRSSFRRKSTSTPDPPLPPPTTPLRKLDERWWLPVPCVPSSGLSDDARRHLKHKRDSATQIHKAAMTINNAVLAEIQIPDVYISSLPKSGKASVGETMYRYMTTAEKFSAEQLLDSLNISSEYEALDLADRVEASMHTWRRKAETNHSKSSWDLMAFVSSSSDADRGDIKNQVLRDRAQTLLFCLKQRFPELSQTSLDTFKIQYNRVLYNSIHSFIPYFLHIVSLS